MCPKKSSSNPKILSLEKIPTSWKWMYTLIRKNCNLRVHIRILLKWQSGPRSHYMCSFSTSSSCLSFTATEIPGEIDTASSGWVSAIYLGENLPSSQSKLLPQSGTTRGMWKVNQCLVAICIPHIYIYIYPHIYIYHYQIL